MTAAVASYHQDRLFGTDVTNVAGFKTVTPRKAKANPITHTSKVRKIARFFKLQRGLTSLSVADTIKEVGLPSSFSPYPSA
jgi:hypothetical protein